MSLTQKREYARFKALKKSFRRSIRPQALIPPFKRLEKIVLEA